MNAPETPVTRVDVSAYTVPTDLPGGDGTLTWSSTTLVLVQAYAGDQQGVGWTYGPTACAEVISGLLSDIVTGRDAMDVTAAQAAMVAAVRNAGRAGVAAMAISAVDTALWDLKARLLGVPLHQLLGTLRSAVPVYGSGGFTTYDDQALTRQLEGWLSMGMRQVKIKVAESWGTREDRDVARMAQVRAVTGEGVELFVDANGGYSANQAVRMMQRVDDLDVRWLEEPVSSDDLDGLAFVRERVRPDVAAGEYGFDLFSAERMCAAGSVDCLQIDVSRCGGITEWQRIAAVAAAHQLDVSAHCSPALHRPIAAATPRLRHVEYFHDHARIESMLFEGAPTVHDGVMTQNTGPGNGLAFRAGDATRFRVR